MKIAIGCDQGGFEMKTELIEHLAAKKISLVDVGSYSEGSVDYPVYAKAVCDKITSGECDLGILVCGTGIGMSMAANKVKGIRAAAVSDCYTAQATRAHNDANVLCLGGRTIGTELAKMIVDIFIDTPFSGEERHARRISMFS